MLSKQEPSGIGGWLILPMIGLIISPIQIMVLLMTTFVPIFSKGYWTILTTPGNEAYHPMWAPLLIFEILGNAFFLVSAVVLLVFFFKKSYRFPKLMIGYIAANIVFVLLDLILPNLIPALANNPRTEEEMALVRAIVSGAIWIPYFIKSVRVKNTFAKVEGLPMQNNTPPPIPASAES